MSHRLFFTCQLIFQFESINDIWWRNLWSRHYPLLTIFLDIDFSIFHENSDSFYSFQLSEYYCRVGQNSSSSFNDRINSLTIETNPNPSFPIKIMPHNRCVHVKLLFWWVISILSCQHFNQRLVFVKERNTSWVVCQLICKMAFHETSIIFSKREVLYWCNNSCLFNI
jgi:hypothetical protein